MSSEFRNKDFIHPSPLFLNRQILRGIPRHSFRRSTCRRSSMGKASTRGTMGAGSVEWDRVLHPLHAVDINDLRSGGDGRTEWRGLSLSECMGAWRGERKRVRK